MFLFLFFFWKALNVVVLLESLGGLSGRELVLVTLSGHGCNIN